MMHLEPHPRAYDSLVVVTEAAVAEVTDSQHRVVMVRVVVGAVVVIGVVDKIGMWGC